MSTPFSVPTTSQRQVALTGDNLAELDVSAYALMQATFERSPIGMAHIRVTGEFVRVNPALCAMLGYPQAELLTMTCLAIISPDDLATTEAHCQRILHGELTSTTFETRYVRQDGAVLWGNLSVSAAFDATGAPTHYLCTLEDITPRIQAEADLATALAREYAARLQSERAAAHLQAVLDVLPVGVAIAGTDGAITSWNPAGRALWADEAPAIMGPHDYVRYDAVVSDSGLVIPPEERATTRALTTGAITHDQEIIIRALDGQCKTLLNSAGPIRDADGTIIGAVVTQVDITERKRLEREVAEHAAELSAIFDSMTEAVSFYNADGSIRRHNAAARALLAQFCVSAAQVEDTTVAERASIYDVRDAQGRPLPREEWPVYRVLHGETLTSKDVVEVTLVAAPDREIITAYTGAPLRGPDGELTGAVLVARDVTEQRHREREREQALNLVSHELKTPLTTMKALTQMVERRLQTTRQEREAELIRRMGRSVESMTRLVNDLVDAARLETGKLALTREQCDLRALCEQVAADQELATGRAITLATPNAPVLIDGDPLRLGQVVTNLLSNALKYSPADRPVSLSLRRTRTQAHILVHDEGPGIPPEALSHLFQRYYRVPGIDVQHGSGVGLGLGLYIAHGLIAMHGGQIRVDSVVDQGTTFEVILPLG